MKKTRLPKQAFFGFWAGHKTRARPPFRQGQWIKTALAQTRVSELECYQLAQNREAWKTEVLRTARVRPPTLPKNPESGQRQCSICNIQFPKANSLKFHYDSHHAVANQSQYQNTHVMHAANTGEMQKACSPTSTSQTGLLYMSCHDHTCKLTMT